MRKYECIEPLELEGFDEEGQSTGEAMILELGTGWHIDEDSSYNLIASNNAIRLIEISDSGYGRWIEIQEDTLEKYFMKVD